MSSPVYCTSDPDQANRYLYLPLGWNGSPWVGTKQTVLDVNPNRYGLFILSHGVIWRTLDAYWRIDTMDVYCHPVTYLWSSKSVHLPIRAEQTDYEALRLEAVFGCSVWAPG